jgi:peptidoglycan/LPS O-acetylase OafA/YrhL
LAGLQDVSFLKPGVIVDPYLRNDPLWSLSYELAFYVVFPPVLAAWTRSPRLATHMIGLVCCVLYACYALWPNHFALVGAYFLLWWAGAMAARAYLSGARDCRPLVPTLGWMLALCGVAAIVVYVAGYDGVYQFPVLPLRHFCVGLAIMAVFFGPIGRCSATLAMRFGRLFSALASISYGLYVLHYPLLVQWDFAASSGGFVLALCLLLLGSYFAEKTLGQILPRASRD